MSLADLYLKSYAFNRIRTLALLDRVAEQSDPAAVLAWRPSPGRAHVGWQIMHVAVTEEIFATERLAPAKTPQFGDLWPSYRGGSTPADEPPTLDEIRRVLAVGRERLIETLGEYSDDRLDEIPAALKERSLNVRTVLDIISWHEAHHHGQAHITLNMYAAQH